MSTAESKKLFSLDYRPLTGVQRGLWRCVRPVLERVLAVRALNGRYADVSEGGALTSRAFCEAVLEQACIRWDAMDSDIERIPRSGRLVVIANHPFGGLEGLILLSILQRIRPDVKVLANYVLAKVPELRDAMIFVDPFGGRAAFRRNLGGLREARAWLGSDGVLVVFPAGEVAHFRPARRSVCEPAWSPTVARLIQWSAAPVLPVFFDGRNSNWFQVLGLVHPRVRTLLLPRELLNKRGARVRLRIGTVIPRSRVAGFGRADELTRYLRVRTLLLGSGMRAGPARRSNGGPATVPQRLAEPVAADRLVAQVAGLAHRRVVSDGSGFDVYCAAAQEMPEVLHEIGRLRELSFREVGEGTGRAADLDRFDADYLHLFAWDRVAPGIAGAYRLGQTDEILPRRGTAGLYTHTLFSFDERLPGQFGPALELGRSFVVKRYQRTYAPLLSLWKGIGRFVAAHPRYRVLFGAVSVSSAYASTTQRLLVEFLRANNFDTETARLLRARRPPRFRGGRSAEDERIASVARSLEDVEELVRDIESDGRGMPVLLRQYLKLNGKLIGFNIDPAFGDVLDGLFYVDLTAVPAPILDRYMGREPAARFRAYHRQVQPTRRGVQSARAGTRRAR